MTSLNLVQFSFINFVYFCKTSTLGYIVIFQSSWSPFFQQSYTTRSHNTISTQISHILKQIHTCHTAQFHRQSADRLSAVLYQAWGRTSRAGRGRWRATSWSSAAANNHPRRCEAASSSSVPSSVKCQSTLSSLQCHSLVDTATPLYSDSHNISSS